MQDIRKFSQAVQKTWSIESSSLWTTDNPAAGQCGVTALVANDVLGAEILKTRYGSIWHFYNRIDGKRHDFTESQFGETIEYDDIPASRDEAFGDTNARQYGYLSNAVKQSLAREMID